MSLSNQALGISNLPERTATVEDFIDMGDTDDITYAKYWRKLYSAICTGQYHI